MASRRKVVADEAHGQLAADEVSGCRPSGEEMQQVAPFAFAVLFELASHYFLCAGVVAIGSKAEFASFERLFDGPAG